jgi:dinuclear metal center YbgI/SA1388 family protein
VTSTELLSLLEQQVAPVSLSDEFCKKCSAYDNSGIIIDGESQIKGILFTLELSPKVVDAAVKNGYNAIVTHHPAIYGGVQRLIPEQSPATRALCECVKRQITVISMHLNFDCASQGIDYYLMKGVGGDNCKTLVNLSCGAYGRVYPVEPVTLGALADRIKREFNSERVLVYGDSQKKIEKAASFCGAGCDDEAITFAAENKADVLISSDIKHHHIAELTARGIGIIILTHYAAEAYGMNKIYQKLKSKLIVSSSYFSDDELL